LDERHHWSKAQPHYKGLKAFVQLYRTEGNYLERVMHFEERVGLDYIQSKLDTAEKIKHRPLTFYNFSSVAEIVLTRWALK
jgi:NAD(P)H-nitrite reductase large subunit